MSQGEGGGGERCGDINFSIDYDFTSQTLKLKIIQVFNSVSSFVFLLCEWLKIFVLKGKDQAARDANGLSDPYVRITLLPDKKVN